MPQSQRGRRTDPDIRARIINLARLDWTPSRIEEKLSLDPEFATRVPSKRTIEFIAGPIRRQKRGDTGDTWNFASSEGDEARLLLPILRWAIEESHGKVLSLTTLQAQWIYRIVSAVPDIPAETAFRRGVFMALVELNGGPLAEAEQALQHFLAFRPWDDMGAAYVDARWHGLISDPPQPRSFDPIYDPAAIQATSMNRMFLEAARFKGPE